VADHPTIEQQNIHDVMDNEIVDEEGGVGWNI